MPITVRDTGSSKKGKPPPLEGGDDDVDVSRGASWLDEEAILEHGRTGRIVHAIKQHSPELAYAIEVYHSADGDRWGGHKWGREFALWPLTEAGRQIAKQAANRSLKGFEHLMAPLDLIATERAAEARSGAPNRARQALLRKADAQAKILLRRMSEAYAEAKAALP